jgi:SagB-type dehydrogenase family enzyme
MPPGTKIRLPQPRHKSDVSIEETLLKRRSIRDCAAVPFTLQEVSQLLWAAQGVTHPRGFRTSPSAGATYPLETYLVVGEAEGLTSGIYRYNPAGHSLLKVIEGDLRAGLAAALGERCVKESAISIIFTAIYERTTQRYGERGIRYVHIEVGHAAQNVCLQAVALELETVVVGAFDDQQIKNIMNLSKEEKPLYILPVGRKK